MAICQGWGRDVICERGTGMMERIRSSSCPLYSVALTFIWGSKKKGRWSPLFMARLRQTVPVTVGIWAAHLLHNPRSKASTLSARRWQLSLASPQEMPHFLALYLLSGSFAKGDWSPSVVVFVYGKHLPPTSPVLRNSNHFVGPLSDLRVLWLLLSMKLGGKRFGSSQNC